MSLTKAQEVWHQVYQQLEATNPIAATAIDNAYRQAITALKSRLPEFKPLGDDRAEALIAALTEYVIECAKEGCRDISAADQQKIALIRDKAQAALDDDARRKSFNAHS